MRQRSLKGYKSPLKRMSRPHGDGNFFATDGYFRQVLGQLFPPVRGSTNGRQNQLSPPVEPENGVIPTYRKNYIGAGVGSPLKPASRLRLMMVIEGVPLNQNFGALGHAARRSKGGRWLGAGLAPSQTPGSGLTSQNGKVARALKRASSTRDGLRVFSIGTPRVVSTSSDKGYTQIAGSDRLFAVNRLWLDWGIVRLVQKLKE